MICGVTVRVKMRRAAGVSVYIMSGGALKLCISSGTVSSGPACDCSS